jgi:hypothetical protein
MGLPFNLDDIRRSLYDHPRDGRSYGTAFNVYLFADPEYAKNPHILKWWTPAHDELIEEQIQEWQWEWYWNITDRILATTPVDTIETWKQEDPTCSHRAWYNILMYFALSRAVQLGLISRIRTPEWKTCPLCGQRFIEDSLSPALVRRLGINNLDFCGVCLRSVTYPRTGDGVADREHILRYLRGLSEVLQRIPPQGYGEGVNDFVGLTSSERLAVFKVLQRKPTIARVKAVFGSSLNALIEAGVLEDGTRRTSRGTQCTAKDGHVCLSLGEKTIDDFLSTYDTPHQREPRYPEGNLCADFVVPAGAGPSWRDDRPP